MPNATARGYQVGVLKETTFGTTPASPLQLMRTTSAAIKVASSFVESEEIQLYEVPDLIRVSADGTFEINGEYSYGAFHTLLEGIFANTWTTNVLSVGSTKTSFTIEDQYTDATKFLPGKGCLVESIAVSLQQGSKITFKITGRIGVVPTAYAGATAGTGAATAAGTNAILSPIASIQLLQEGGSLDLKGVGVTQFNFEFSRPGIAQPQLGSLSLSGLDPSTFVAKGSASLYVPTTGASALLDKYLGDTATSLAATLGGASNLKDAYLWNQVKFTDGGIAPVGRGQACIQSFQWQARYDATNTTCKITRTP
ncbi:MAG: hypothetical protein K2R93_12360 [Gemmatimonadaceae bacterium]|nr:hypothetical protein [Gemmatimonadaceae bacterium]